MVLAAQPVSTDVEPLIEKVRRYNPEVDADLLRRAYACAEKSHEGQFRDAGEPYVTHPLAVAHILADLASDTPSLIAGLLHDVVEDTGLDLAHLETEFGPEVAKLVDGVTKLSQAELSQRRLQEGEGEALDMPRTEEEMRKQAANIRKIFLAMARDVRVMIVKLADRMHNMQTLESLPEPRRRKIASETLQIFAPLAHRLGIWHFKWQLEDLSFKYLHPEEYESIVDKLARTRLQREADVTQVKEMLQDRLRTEGITAEIQGRPKHLYSIWNKINKQELDFDQLFDLIAVRVLVDTVSECYHALGVVHELWLPIPGLFSDHIARPKPNMYQSLHTKVIGPRGEPVEIQIRTKEMHRTADFGIAAHWQYKEGGRPDRRFEEKMTWLRQQLFDWQTDSTNDKDFLRAVVEDLFTDQVFVFTPRGDVIDLPTGSGPLDFAFRVHTEMGLHCVGAKVNGRLRPLTYQFKNGDIVEIMTRPSAQPSYDWLNLVKSSHAKSRIKAWFRKQRYAENLQRGREMLEKEVHRQSLDPKECLKADRLQEVASQYNYASSEDLLASIGFGHTTPSAILNRLQKHEPQKKEIVTGRPVAEAKLTISAGGVDDVFIKRSKCCQPLPGEDVVGYVSRGKGMAIHRRGCPNIEHSIATEPDRVTPVLWRNAGEEKHPVRITIETLDRGGLLSEISAVFSERKVNIEEINVKTLAKKDIHSKMAAWDLVIDVADVEEMERLLRILSAMPDVLSVSRVGPSTNGKSAN